MSSPDIVIAISCHGVFDVPSAKPIEAIESPFPKGVAFSLVKALQEINEKLAAKESKDHAFRVVLVARDLQEIQGRIVSSVEHYGLQMVTYCFCGSDDFTESLQATKVQLFLSSDASDVCEALHQGTPAALLSPWAWAPEEGDQEQPLSPIKVLLSGDVMSLPEEKLRGIGFTQPELQNMRAAKASMPGFASVMVEMKRLLDGEGGSLRVTLLSSLGTRDEFASALQTARRWGLEVDEAYCLAGAPYGPLVNCIQPHILCYNGLYSTTEVPLSS